MNPLLEKWSTPFALAPFDRVADAHLGPAIRQRLAEREAAVQAIANNPEPPSFENTIEAMERAALPLQAVMNVYYCLNSACRSAELEELAREVSPLLARHELVLAQYPGLFRRIDELYRSRAAAGLDEARLRLLERTWAKLIRDGAGLAPDDRDRFAEITARLATLQTAFAQNLMHEERSWALLLSEADLEGLPASLREAAAHAARERGHEGKWAITLGRSLAEAFLTFSPRRDLRERLYQAWSGRGEARNLSLIAEILTLRQQKARLLGYATFADFRLDDTMAKSTSAVRELLDTVWEPARARAEAECRILEDLAPAEGISGPLRPWDWRYLMEKARTARYAIDAIDLKPYFRLDAMVGAAFDTARRLFGLTFVPRPDLRTFHPDVAAYEVGDAASSPVVLLLLDNFSRPTKQSGAWMGYLHLQHRLDGEVLPVVTNSSNIARSDCPLLSLDEVRTLFHEFGHGLHGMLSAVRYPSQSGTNVRIDFVELASQIFEQWAFTPEVLGTHARHVRTGEPMPLAMIGTGLEAARFGQGILTAQYTASALADLELHTAPAETIGDPGVFEAAVFARIGLPPAVGPRHRAAHFSHLFSDDAYAAAYYCYLWAEVLAADGFAAFEETGDLFSKPTAERLREVLASGDTRDPMDLYRQFRGRPPRLEALLAKRGLARA